MPKAKWLPMMALLVVGAMDASAAPRQPVLPVSPLDTVETLRGTLSAKGEGRSVVVTIENPDGSGFRRFDVDLESAPKAVLDLQHETGEIHYWRGHLVVVAPDSGKALHFAIKDVVRPARVPVAPLSTASEVAELDSILRSRYELTRSSALGINSLSGPRAVEAGDSLRSHIAPVDIDYQDPGSGGGISTCGSSCNITCGDGSSCSSTCMGTRCASCTCPASCSCK